MAGSLLTAFFAETAIVSYRAYHNGISIPAQAPINVPIPAQYTSVVIAFGALALIPGEGARVAGAIGWGLVVATLLNLWSPAGKAAQTTAKQTTKTPDLTRSQAPNFMGPLPSK